MRFKTENGLPFLIHDGSYSKPDKAAKAKLLQFVDESLCENMYGHYFVTVNTDEMLAEDFKRLDEADKIVAKLERNDNHKNRFFGFKYN